MTDVEWWTKFPETKPTVSGYYYTYYYNFEERKHFYKAHFWSVVKDEWVWRIKPEVKGYVECTRNDYYVPCALSVPQEVPACTYG